VTIENDLRAEVAILGGGLPGRWLGIISCARGWIVVLVDRRDIARGSTAASTGLLQYEIDKLLIDLIPLVGARTAGRAYQLGTEALE